MATYTCPTCGAGLEPIELQQPGGVGGGTYCPKCQERVYFSFPYSKLVIGLSLLLAIGTMLLFRVTSVSWFFIGTVLTWFLISLFLNVYSTKFKPATLKKWKPRKGKTWKPRKGKTFFEWLYERDQIRAPDLSDDEKSGRKD